MLTIKCGREEFELTEKDVIMYNGACYQIITQSTGEYGRYTPIIATSKVKKLIKENKLIFDKKIDSYITHYKINVEA